MSSSEEETSLIKTPQRPQGQGHDQGHSAPSEKAKAERLKRQRELQAAFKERMREKQESQRRAAELKEASQSVLEDPPQENAQGPVSFRVSLSSI